MLVDMPEVVKILAMKCMLSKYVEIFIFSQIFVSERF